MSATSYGPSPYHPGSYAAGTCCEADSHRVQVVLEDTPGKVGRDGIPLEVDTIRLIRMDGNREEVAPHGVECLHLDGPV